MKWRAIIQVTPWRTIKTHPRYFRWMCRVDVELWRYLFRAKLKYRIVRL